MKCVLYFQSSFRDVNRRIADGVRRYAAGAGWRLHVVPYANATLAQDDAFGNVRDASSLSAVMETWNPDGIIVDWVEQWRKLCPDPPRVPHVFADPEEPIGGPAVRCDNAAVARAAAVELARLDVAAFAVLPSHVRIGWSEERTAEFRSAMADLGVGRRTVVLPRCQRQINAVDPELAERLRRLPKPCGLFAVNDYAARCALDAAADAGIAVPGELAVIGADDDESRCEGTGTSLTSVRIDFEGCGETAAEMLQEWMRRPSRRPGDRAFGVSGVVRRASTRRLARFDPLVSDAMETIRLRYAEGVTLASIAAGSGVNLRTLERRFLAAAGHTVGEELRNVRFEAAQRLMSSPEPRNLQAVANLCGYDSESTLRKAFAARLGMSPAEWRSRR